MFGSFSLDSTATQSSKKTNNQFKTKKYFKENKMSGLYQQFDPYTGQLKQEGKFQNGIQTGLWKQIEEDGDQIHYNYTLQRCGAVCGDGSRSYATGRGACSHHGGVAQWLYDSVKHKVGGTGKHMPLEQRVQALKKKVKETFSITKSGLEFQEHILTLLLEYDQQNNALTEELSQKQELLEICGQEQQNMMKKIEQLKAENKQLQIKLASKNNSVKEVLKTQKKDVKQLEIPAKTDKNQVNSIQQKKVQKTQQTIKKDIKIQPILNKQAEKVEQQNKQGQGLQRYRQETNKNAKKYQQKKPQLDDDWQSDDENNEDNAQNTLINELLQRMKFI